MKKYVAITLVLLTLLLTACGGNTAPETTAESPETTEAAPVTETTTEEPTLPPPEVDRSAEEIYKNHPELTPVDYGSPALLPISDDAGEEYLGRLTFLCDSPTYWLKPFGLLPGGTDTKQIWTGPEGTMTLAYLRDYKIVDPFDGVQRTIADTVALRKPDIIVIAVGVNGIAFMDEDYFTREYEHLIDVIRDASPETKIIAQSIYPISPRYKNWGMITNASITAGNSWILKIAEKYGIPYMDAFSALVGEDGNIIPELVMRDGLHPNKDGLAKVLEFIRTHAYLP